MQSHTVVCEDHQRNRIQLFHEADVPSVDEHGPAEYGAEARTPTWRGGGRRGRGGGGGGGGGEGAGWGDGGISSSRVDVTELPNRVSIDLRVFGFTFPSLRGPFCSSPTLISISSSFAQLHVSNQHQQALQRHLRALLDQRQDISERPERHHRGEDVAADPRLRGGCNFGGADHIHEDVGESGDECGSIDGGSSGGGGRSLDVVVVGLEEEGIGERSDDGGEGEERGMVRLVDGAEGGDVGC